MLVIGEYRARQSIADYKSPIASSALLRIDRESSGSATTRDIISAPIIVEAATKACFFAASGVRSSNPAASISTSFPKLSVATARVFLSGAG